METAHYLDDTSVDGLARIVTELASEVWILRDRNMVLEQLLTQSGVLEPGAVSRFQPEGEFNDTVRTEGRDFVRRVFGSVLDYETRGAAALAAVTDADKR